VFNHFLSIRLGGLPILAIQSEQSLSNSALIWANLHQ